LIDGRGSKFRCQLRLARGAVARIATHGLRRPPSAKNSRAAQSPGVEAIRQVQSVVNKIAARAWHAFTSSRMTATGARRANSTAATVENMSRRRRCRSLYDGHMIEQSAPMCPPEGKPRRWI
jgi:hypothetical protein